MSKSDTFENDLLKLIFHGTAIANIADNAAASPLTSLYASAHTADPGEAGTEATNEISYTGYARKAIARNSGGFTVSGSSCVTAADNDWPEMSGGAGGTITHFAIGVASSGATKILYKGAVTPNILVALGVTPRLKAGTSITED
jgi:hypothetical protein